MHYKKQQGKENHGFLATPILFQHHVFTMKPGGKRGCFRTGTIKGSGGNKHRVIGAMQLPKPVILLKYCTKS